MGGFDKEMQKALEADGEYLRQMTGEDHGPHFWEEGSFVMTEAGATERLGRFGHHPDPAIDFCIEVETLQGEIFDLGRGLTDGRMSSQEFIRRFDRAMTFRVGGDLNAVAAKGILRALRDEAQKVIAKVTA